MGSQGGHATETSLETAHGPDQRSWGLWKVRLETDRSSRWPAPSPLASRDRTALGASRQLCTGCLERCGLQRRRRETAGGPAGLDTMLARPQKSPRSCIPGLIVRALAMSPQTESIPSPNHLIRRCKTHPGWHSRCLPSIGNFTSTEKYHGEFYDLSRRHPN